MEFNLTRKIMSYLLMFLQKRQITKDNQFLDPVRYYFMTGYLRNFGLIQENGFDKQQKIWTLTPRGYKVAILIKKIEEVME